MKQLHCHLLISLHRLCSKGVFIEAGSYDEAAGVIIQVTFRYIGSWVACFPFFRSSIMMRSAKGVSEKVNSYTLSSVIRLSGKADRLASKGIAHNPQTSEHNHILIFLCKCLFIILCCYDYQKYNLYLKLRMLYFFFGNIWVRLWRFGREINNREWQLKKRKSVFWVIQ